MTVNFAGIFTRASILIIIPFVGRAMVCVATRPLFLSFLFQITLGLLNFLRDDKADGTSAGSGREAQPSKSGEHTFSGRGDRYRSQPDRHEAAFPNLSGPSAPRRQVPVGHISPLLDVICLSASPSALPGP